MNAFSPSFNNQMNAMHVDVECTFAAAGAVRVRRIALDGRWQAVEQGRQWQDDAGRHILIKLKGHTHTLTLQTPSLTWHIQPLLSGRLPA